MDRMLLVADLLWPKRLATRGLQPYTALPLSKLHLEKAKYAAYQNPEEIETKSKLSHSDCH